MMGAMKALGGYSGALGMDGMAERAVVRGAADIDPLNLYKTELEMDDIQARLVSGPPRCHFSRRAAASHATPSCTKLRRTSTGGCDTMARQHAPLPQPNWECRCSSQRPLPFHVFKSPDGAPLPAELI